MTENSFGHRLRIDSFKFDFTFVQEGAGNHEREVGEAALAYCENCLRDKQKSNLKKVFPFMLPSFSV